MARCVRAPGAALGKSSVIERILYTSFVDISLPNGPGVNERGFLMDMLQRYGDRLFAVIPAPRRGVPGELASLRTELIPISSGVRDTLGWVQVRSLGLPRLARAIDRFDPDLVVYRTGALPIPHLYAARSRRVPYAIKTAGDISHRAFYAAGGVRRLVRSANEKMFGDLLRGAIAIDVVSEEQKATIARFDPTLEERVAVIDNGVDPTMFHVVDNSPVRERFGIGEEEVVIGFAGNLPMRRGGREVVEAVAALRARYPVRGIVVGDSGEADACRRLAKELGVDDRIAIVGEAAFEEMPSLIGAMDVGLSVLRVHERGASEQKVRQYLACGACVVGTAGSNDFLRGREFVKVVEEDATEVVVAAVEAFVRQGRQAIRGLGFAARDYAVSHLSIAARNENRLDLWGRALSGSENRRSIPGARSVGA